MSDSIVVRWSGRERTFSPGAVVRFGRDGTGDVVIANDNVSRRHAELIDTGAHWELRDLGSAQGTWRDGVRTPVVVIDGAVSVSLGQPPHGAVVELALAGATGAAPLPGTVLPGVAGTVRPGGDAQPRTPSAPLPPPPTPVPASGTIIVGGTPDRPGGRLRDDAVAGATVVTGDSLNLECAGRSYTFQPGRVVTLGRDESCDVVTSNPTVSRRHATLRHDGTAWVLEDGASAGGTFVDGARVSSRRLSGSTAAWLGPVDTGERIVLVVSGPTKRAKASGPGVRWAVAGLAVLAAIVLAAGVVAVVDDRGSGGPDEERLARATVRIDGSVTVPTSAGECSVELSGSGTIVDADQGLILTNAHVVKPTASGLERETLDDCGGIALPDPDVLAISVTDEKDQPSEPSYFAEVVGWDGYLDLAVIRITESLGGRLLEPGEVKGLVDVPLGDSDDVGSGDPVVAVGFPADAASPSASITEGIVSAVVSDPELELNRAAFNFDAGISQGSSGGLLADRSGALIAVPTAIRGGRVSVARPVNLAIPLIEAARTNKGYNSPYA